MISKLYEPIFIGGFFKSGTSLLRAILGQHSAIATGLESYWFDFDWHGPRDEDFKKHIDRLREFYDMNHADLDSIVESSSSALDFLGNFLSCYASSIGKKRWAEKTPGNILHIDKILNEIPDAKIIHIIRDPRDIFTSLRQANKWDTVQEFVDMWCRFLGTAQELENRLKLTKDNYLTIRYESLVLDTALTMKSVLSFLSEEWEDSVAAFSGKKGEYEKVLAVTGKASTTLDRLRQPLSQNRVGIWKDTIPENEIESIHRGICEKGLSPLLSKIEQETLRFL